jgi:hypothetical protein
MLGAVSPTVIFLKVRCVKLRVTTSAATAGHGAWVETSVSGAFLDFSSEF